MMVLEKHEKCVLNIGVTFTIQMLSLMSTFSFISVLSVSVSETNPFMDNEWFAINWMEPGYNLNTRHDVNPELGTTVVMMSSSKEKYNCFVPSLTKQSREDSDTYSGPSARELIAKLHSASSCSYRIESYWTYELCHGKYLKQFHGDKDSEKNSAMVFSLGYYKEPKVTEDDLSKGSKREPVKIRKLENIDLRYYEENMDDGTKCELTGKPRSVSVLYVCQPHGRGEIYQLKEVATCQYELIVLTEVLCNHPDYRPKLPTVNKIRCEGVGGAPKRPKQYAENFPDEEKQTFNTIVNMKKQQASNVPVKEDVKPSSQYHTPPRRPIHTTIGSVTDKQTLHAFFTGQHCIYGGTGWWRYEFCYNRHLSQYHQDSTGRTTVTLGKWNEVAHRAWILSNPQYTPLPPGKRQLLHFYYGNGEFCPEASTLRQVVVKIKCQKHSTHPHSITLYLLEPKMCQYELVVESQLFCLVLDQADRDGVLHEPVV